MSHVSLHRAAAAAPSVTQTTGGAGGQGAGGGGGVAVILPNSGSLLNGGTLSGPLPVVHVFDARGHVIGVRPVLSSVSLNVTQRTGGPGGTGGGGGGGVAILMVPTITTTLPKFGSAHGKLYRIFPPINQPSGISVTQTTGGAGGANSGGGGGFAIMIPVSVTVPIVSSGRNRSVVPVYLVSSPIPTVIGSSVTQQTGGPGGAGGGGGGGISLWL